jgi:hypothetical protein
MCFNQRQFLILVLYILSATFFGCSSVIEAPIVSKHAKVSRQGAIIVMGIELIEEYNNTEWRWEEPDSETNQPIKKNTTDSLLAKLDTYIQRGKFTETTESINPIHDIKNITFTFLSKENRQVEMVRYGKSPLGYSLIGIHQFEEGTYKLKGPRYSYKKWVFESHATGAAHHEFIKNIDQDILDTEISSGDVLYLGHLTLYFKTKKKSFGLINPQVVNIDTKLVRVSLTNRFEETKHNLQENSPWFPITEMKDRSTTGNWTFEDLNLIEEKKRQPTKATKPDKSQKSDTEEYFF